MKVTVRTGVCVGASQHAAGEELTDEVRYGSNGAYKRQYISFM